MAPPKLTHSDHSVRRPAGAPVPRTPGPGQSASSARGPPSVILNQLVASVNPRVKSLDSWDQAATHGLAGELARFLYHAASRVAVPGPPTGDGHPPTPVVAGCR